MSRTQEELDNPPGDPASPNSYLCLELWHAATRGNLEEVIRLTADPSVDVNYTDSIGHRSPFYRACGHGQLEVVRFLVRDPRVDVTLPNHADATPFFIACQEGHHEIVKKLMRDPRVDIIKGKDDLATPFLITLEAGHTEIVETLLGDPRIDPNIVMRDGKSPLFMACQNGNLEAVMMLLSSPVEIQVDQQRQSDHRGPEQMATWAARQPKWHWENGDEDQKRRATNCPAIADLIQAYRRNPSKVRSQMVTHFNKLGTSLHPLFSSLHIQVSPRGHQSWPGLLRCSPRLLIFRKTGGCFLCPCSFCLRPAVDVAGAAFRFPSQTI